MEDSTILIVDDTPSSIFLLKAHVKKWGYIPLTAGSGEEALEILKKESIAMIISDHMMPGMDGMELLEIVKKQYEDIPFVILTAHGSIDNAVHTMKHGADDYVTKPYNTDELRTVVHRLITYRRISRENRELKEYHDRLHGFQNIITRSPLMLKAIDFARKVAESPDTTVSIYGESGAGKELFARAIHTASGCMENRFIGINCAGVPSSLLESELFGHVKGAFTGADRERKGKFGLAQKGTILLDEIGDMHPDLQAKLLRVLQERTYEKVGSDKQIKTSARIITATHQNLVNLVKAGKFRKDLFHRIQAYPINLIPLRERIEDIPLLVEHFIEKFRSELGKYIPGVSQTAMEVLMKYSWPGNVRELKNCIERASIITNGELIRPEHLTLRRQVERSEQLMEDENHICINISFDKNDFSLKAAVDRILEIALKKCKNNKARAAEFLGIDRKMFYRRKSNKKK